MNTAIHRSARNTPGAWLPRLLTSLCLVLSLGLLAHAGWAQTDPPGRVGRLSDLRGAVSWWDDETGRWTDATRNQPLTGGDRISTAAGGSAEVRVGSTVLRLGETTELEVLRLDDERMAFQLHSGHLALRVRSREVAPDIELVTAEVRLAPLGAGHFRLDRIDDTTQATSWRGELRIVDPAGFVIAEGQRVELYRERRGNALRFQIGVPVNDRYADAVLREDQREARSVSARYVSPEMTGVEDLDRDGRWEQHPEFGAVWLPLNVAADWAPYSDGRWTWVQPWGWTWVDNARWGFAPLHYGRWAWWRNAWCWVPGAYVARPVYAPALVAWVGGGGWGQGPNLGGPSVGWLPLAPREVYAPYYAVTPRYRERINPTPPYRWQPDRGRGPVVFGNQGVPHAVTVVPRDNWLQRQPVRRRDNDGRDGRENRGGRDGWDGRDGRAARDDRPRGNPEPLAAVAAPLPPPDARQPDSRGPERGAGGRDGRAPPVAVQPAPAAAPQLQAQPQPPQPQLQPQPQPRPRQQAAPQPTPQPAPQPALQPALQPSPQPTPTAAAPAAPPAAAPKPAVDRSREGERERGRERERERRPAGGDGARPSRETENQK
jgi:hypothetical protein